MEKHTIYMDNAATTLPKPPEVAEAIVQAMNHLGNAGRGKYGGGVGCSRELSMIRGSGLEECFMQRIQKADCLYKQCNESLNICAIQGLINPGIM